MGWYDEFKPLIHALVTELVTMDLDQVKAFQDDWTARLEAENAPEVAKKICGNITETVIKHKKE